MSPTWRSSDEPAMPPVSPAGWLRVTLRGLVLLVLLGAGLVVLGVVRLPERLIVGPRRPVSPQVVRGVSRAALAIIGIGYRKTGQPLRGAGAMVANHSSWLDIFALNAGGRVCFVAKAEVAGWPGIGWLARAAGTVFIARDSRQARAHVAIFRARLAVGDRLLFFPEGTSTDGQRVLPFKTTLFEALLDPALRDGLQLQPVSVVWRAPAGADARFYGWWGDMGFGPHLLAMLAAPRHGTVTVVYHAPLSVAAHPGRKQLAAAAEAAVRAGMTARA